MTYEQVLASVFSIVGDIRIRVDGNEIIAKASFGVGGHSDYQAIIVCGSGETLIDALASMLAEYVYQKRREGMLPEYFAKLMDKIDALDPSLKTSVYQRLKG